MRITDIRDVVVPIFTDVVRDGRPAVGFGFEAKNPLYAVMRPMLEQAPR